MGIRTKVVTERVVYRHPKGRFIVVERCWKDIYGEEHCIRETRYPRPKQRESAPEPKPEPTIKTIRVMERDKARFAKLYRQGYTTEKIAEIFGCSKSTVFRYLKLMGLIRRRKKLTDSDKAKIKNLARNGMSGVKIAAAIGFHITTVNKYLRSIGIRKNKPRLTMEKEVKT